MVLVTLFSGYDIISHHEATHRCVMLEHLIECELMEPASQLYADALLIVIEKPHEHNEHHDTVNTIPLSRGCTSLARHMCHEADWPVA